MRCGDFLNNLKVEKYVYISTSFRAAVGQQILFSLLVSKRSSFWRNQNIWILIKYLEAGIYIVDLLNQTCTDYKVSGKLLLIAYISI